MKKRKNSSGQMILEYAIMFIVILLVVIYAATQFVKPSVCRFYRSSAGVIDSATNLIENVF